jgi:hypothetical protein
METVEAASIEEYLKLIKERKTKQITLGNREDFLFRGQVTTRLYCQKSVG